MMWRCQFYYKDWQGVSHKKNKRGFKTKAEAEQWERDFLQQQQRNLDINFENFVQIYYEDMEHRLRENTMRTKKFIIDLKIIPYFKKKNMNEIKASDIRAWQNELMKKGYSETYLKTVNNQLSAIFNYAVRYYDLKDNPCRKAGSIGKSHAGEKEFWTKQEFNVENKPETKMAFLLLYWTGMRIGELLALTYNDIDLEKRTISVNKSYQRIEGRDIITPPKTPKSKRVITIPPFLVEELKEYTSYLYGIMADERMFRFTKSYMEHEIIRDIKASGVKRIRLHDLRHSHEKHLSVLDFEKKERAKEVAELEQTISGSKEELADILHQQIAAGQETEQIRKEGEAIRQEVSELSVTNLLLKEQTETLTEDKGKLLSENEKLEKQQKKLQQEINKMVQSKEVMERNIHAYDEDVKWQLAEPGALMSAKAYRDKKALPLVEKLKEVVKNLTIKCVQLTEQGKKLTAKVDGQQKQISRLTDKVMEQSGIIDRLQERASDLGRLERHLGREQVQSIVERSKALEQAERVNKRPKRAFEMSR